MKLHYGGIYKSEKDLKVFGESRQGEVAFREPSQKKFALIANGGSLILFAALIVVFIFFGKPSLSFITGKALIPLLLSVFVIVPHEFLHAICFKGDVYLYFDPKKLVAFVHGTESMSKARFIFLSLLPNIVFGFVPFIAFLINRELLIFGLFGAICISMGFGDYINVFNAATQMPKGARTYMKGFHSYWYIPKE